MTGPDSTQIVKCQCIDRVSFRSFFVDVVFVVAVLVVAVLVVVVVGGGGGVAVVIVAVPVVMFFLRLHLPSSPLSL